MLGRVVLAAVIDLVSDSARRVRPAADDVVTDRRVGHGHVVLVDEPFPDSLDAVPPARRNLKILTDDGVDQVAGVVAERPRAWTCRLRGDGWAEPKAWATVRRCTRWRAARARIERSSCWWSARMAANSRVRDSCRCLTSAACDIRSGCPVRGRGMGVLMRERCRFGAGRPDTWARRSIWMRVRCGPVSRARR
jgi:hypothetical protein